MLSMKKTHQEFSELTQGSSGVPFNPSTVEAAREIYYQLLPAVDNTIVATAATTVTGHKLQASISKAQNKRSHLIKSQATIIVLLKYTRLMIGRGAPIPRGI